MAYDSTALLVEIGSCLGLWLGLSIVGVYDLIARVAFQAEADIAFSKGVMLN